MRPAALRYAGVVALVLFAGAAAPGSAVAQFQLPPVRPAGAAEGAAPADPTADPTVFGTQGHWPRTLVQDLRFQYGYGSESAAAYRRNPDLNKAVPDNLLLVNPQLNGIVVYRPADWLELTLEMIAELELASYQPEIIVLPNGRKISDLPDTKSLLVDQAYVTVKRVFAPFEVSAGRRNYEDERHWLLDTSLDVASIVYREGPFRVDVFGGREVWLDMNFWPGQVEAKDRVNTTMVYFDYRGIEDLRLAAYQFTRDDLSRNLGRPRLTGVRALGRPGDELNYWGELAFHHGKDPDNKPYKGLGLDVGFTYRFLDLPLRPNVTLAYAYGSGDDDPDDGTNHAFQQTGLQSNESRFAGTANFKYYGEALDPELSNLRVFTVGVGFWPSPNVTVDLVYHRYLLNKLADEVPGSPITAEMSQVDTRLSKDVGKALDVVVGLRNLFGIRRFGVDLRMGWFFPGTAFLRNDGTDDAPLLRRADKSLAFVAKLWW